MRFNSKPIEEHTEVPLADEGRWDALVEHWQQRGPIEAGDAPERNACYVLSVHPRRRCPRPGHPRPRSGSARPRAP